MCGDVGIRTCFDQGDVIGRVRYALGRPVNVMDER